MGQKVKAIYQIYYKDAIYQPGQVFEISEVETVTDLIKLKAIHIYNVKAEDKVETKKAEKVERVKKVKTEEVKTEEVKTEEVKTEESDIDSLI